MNKELIHGILERVAENNCTDVCSVKREIERCTFYSEQTREMTWDEAVLFFSCLAVLGAGYTDIYG